MAQSPIVQIGSCQVTVQQGSITKLHDRVDALVSSDDNYLTHGGGVSGAIWRQAGQGLVDFVAEHLVPLGLGSLFISPPGKVNAGHIVHAITIDLDTNRHAKPRNIQDLFAALFATADQRGWDSLALPLIGAGAGNVESLEVVRSLCIALLEHSGTHPGKIILCMLPEVHAICLKEIRKYESGSGATALSSKGAPDSTVDSARHTYGVIGGVFGGVLGSAIGNYLKEKEQNYRIESLGSQPGLDKELPFNSEANLKGWLQASSGLESIHFLEIGLLELLRIALAQVRDPAAITALLNVSPLIKKAEFGLKLSEGELPQLTLAMKWGLASKALRASGIDFPPNLSASIEEAIRSRNILVHHGGDESVTRALSQGVLGLIEWLNRFDKSFSMTLPASPTTKVNKATRQSFPKHSPPLAGSSVLLPESHGTRAVIELRKFLRESMDPEDLEGLIKDREQMGYKGDPDAILLEFCVHQEDLVELLKDHVTAPKLRRKLQDRGLTPRPGATSQALAVDLLEFLGFPRKLPVSGVNRLRDILLDAKQKMSDCTPAGVCEQIIYCSKELEWCLKVFARFLVQWAFKTKAVDPFLIERGWMDKGYRLEGQSLGFYSTLIQKMEAEIRQSSDFREFCRDIGSEPILPSSVAKIAEIRNLFVHDKRDKNWQSKLTESEIPARGKEFIEHAIQLVEHLGRTEFRAFPFVVRIESITIDNWGRRIIRATSDGEPGKTEETIFTEMDLRPGELYLMRPLSNPWRVQPVLVAIGDAAEGKES